MKIKIITDVHTNPSPIINEEYEVVRTSFNDVQQCTMFWIVINDTPVGVFEWECKVL